MAGLLGMADRNATKEPSTVTNDPPALTTAFLYNSFIYNDIANTGQDTGPAVS